MSEEAVKRFLALFRSDPYVQQRVAAVPPGNREDVLQQILQIASEAGCTFTASEYKEYLAAINNQSLELDDSDLDHVVGGLQTLYYSPYLLY